MIGLKLLDEKTETIEFFYAFNFIHFLILPGYYGVNAFINSDYRIIETLTNAGRYVLTDRESESGKPRPLLLDHV